VRTRVPAAFAVVATLALAGCSQKDDQPEALPAMPVVEPPAASAGGACILWDYAFIEEKIGLRFTVAAGSEVDDTATCVVRTAEADAPALVLTVSSSSANAELFNDDLKPARSTTLKGLGQAAYKQVTKQSAKSGPVIEVGWLSEGHQLQSLKFTFAKGAKPAAMTDMTTKLVGMAESMDTIDATTEKASKGSKGKKS
jgi:type IV pilus biogenesis protein CpaD/CtpE